MSLTGKRIWGKVLLFILIALLVVVSLFPRVWAVFGSFKESQELYNHPYKLLPIAPTLGNYGVLFNLSNFFRSFLNLYSPIICKIMGSKKSAAYAM